MNKPGRAGTAEARVSGKPARAERGARGTHTPSCLEMLRGERSFDTLTNHDEIDMGVDLSCISNKGKKQATKL